jgi:hypothetical protein
MGRCGMATTARAAKALIVVGIIGRVLFGERFVQMAANRQVGFISSVRATTSGNSRNNRVGALTRRAKLLRVVEVVLAVEN